MGIKNDLQCKKSLLLPSYFCSIFYKCCIYQKKISYIEFSFTILQKALNAIYNLYYEDWDLITKLWSESTNLNTPFEE